MYRMGPGILPPIWCKWQPSSLCSVELCPPVSNLTQKQEGDPAPDVFCLDQRKVYKLLENGEKKRVFPEFQRRRQCRCQTLNVFKTLFEPKCKYEAIETECVPCRPNENRIYRSSESKELLRNCSEVFEDIRYGGLRGSTLYMIIGGALGTAVFIALLLCCVRFLMAEVRQRRTGTSSLSLATQRQRSRRRSGGNNQTIGAPGSLPLCENSYNTELPPAYKDVVHLNTFSTAPPNSSQKPFYSMQPPDVACPIDQAQLEEVEEQPPSYQEVIALSPTAAIMHQRILAAQSQRSQQIQNEQQQEQLPEAGEEEEEPRVQFREHPSIC